MRARPKPWSFETVSQAPTPGSPARVEHRMRCSRCGAEASRPAHERLNPEMVVKTFSRSGWQTDLTNKRLCVCPACVSNKKAQDPDEMISKVTKLPTAAQPSSFEAKPPREAITPDQKAVIRRLLDSHFDDSKGMYLDGYSDQRIGQEANVPWAFVKDIREAAYGEIRIDPVMAEYQRELLTLEERLGKVSERAQSVSAEAQTVLRDVQALRRRIAEHGGAK